MKNARDPSKSEAGSTEGDDLTVRVIGIPVYKADRIGYGRVGVERRVQAIEGRLQGRCHASAPGTA